MNQDILALMVREHPVALGLLAPVQECSVAKLYHLSVEMEALLEVRARLEFPGCQGPFLVPVQHLVSARAVSMALQEVLLSLAAWGAQVPLVLVLKLQEQEEAPLLGHLRHNQEHPLLEVLPLGDVI